MKFIKTENQQQSRTNTQRSAHPMTWVKALTATTCLFIANLAFAGQTEIDKIEQAASVLNTTELQTLSERYNGYDKGLSLYRLALSHNLKGAPAQANTSIDEAIAVMESLRKAQPENVEYKALLAQIYGYKIALEPGQGAVYGIKSNQLLAEAEAQNANHPRVLLIKGIAKLNTPPMYGGGREHAKTAFMKAVAAYQNDKYSDYYWGEPEAYTWLGLVRLQEGDKVAAQADWQTALKLNPDYRWAKMLVQQHQ